MIQDRLIKLIYNNANIKLLPTYFILRANGRRRLTAVAGRTLAQGRLGQLEHTPRPEAQPNHALRRVQRVLAVKALQIQGVENGEKRLKKHLSMEKIKGKVIRKIKSDQRER
jgi:hypothetical protein